MQYIPTSSFGRRTHSAAQLSARALARTPLPDQRRSKWDILRDLTRARRSFGLSDRALTVLSALISFHPDTDLGTGNTVVFPSNAALSARAHGMADSTLRRHIAALVEAGLILRRDSPNGKRYARRNSEGTLAVAYGFDLRPLILRDAEISAAARAALEEDERRKALRETIVLAIRDCSALLGQHAVLHTDLEAQLDDLRRKIRRKLDIATLKVLADKIHTLLHTLEGLSTAEETQKMSGSDPETERHIQDSKNDTFESERQDQARPKHQRDLSLALVLQNCREAQTWVTTPMQNWSDIHRCATTLSPMMGISAEVWTDAQKTMGPVPAAVTVLAMLQKMQKVRSPGAYLRSLTKKAATGRFHPAPMVQALSQTPPP